MLLFKNGFLTPLSEEGLILKSNQKQRKAKKV